MWPFKNKGIQNKARDKPRPSMPRYPARMLPVRRVRADVSITGSEAIYAAVSRISNTVASLPLHLYRDYEIQVKHPLERLISRAPNQNFTSFGFLQTMEVCRNTEGNAYALIVPDKLGAVKRLDILNPTQVRPQRHPTTGDMWYIIRLDDGKEYPLPGFQMVTLRHMSGNGEVGVRPIDVLRGTLDYDAQVKEFSLTQLDGVNQGVFLTVPNSGLGPNEREAVVNSFLDAYEKSGQRVVVLEGGLTATTFSQSPINAQVLDVERIMRNRVATVYNIPPHMLGDYGQSAFTTAEQQMREFYQMTIMPIVSQWEQELNRKLLTDKEIEDGYCFRFDTDALSRADTATTADKHQKAIRGGWMRVNEVRKREGLPPDPYGDELLISRDLIPVRIPCEQPELLLAALRGSKTAASAENAESDDENSEEGGDKKP